MYGEYKEVYFDKYCHLCEFYDGAEDEDPCFECLQNGANINSHKPLCWKEATKN